MGRQQKNTYEVKSDVLGRTLNLASLFLKNV
jgi:hypothetical protein